MSEINDSSADNSYPLEENLIDISTSSEQLHQPEDVNDENNIASHDLAPLKLQNLSIQDNHIEDLLDSSAVNDSEVHVEDHNGYVEETAEDSAHPPHDHDEHDPDENGTAEETAEEEEAVATEETAHAEPKEYHEQPAVNGEANSVENEVEDHVADVNVSARSIGTEEFSDEQQQAGDVHPEAESHPDAESEHNGSAEADTNREQHESVSPPITLQDISNTQPEPKEQQNLIQTSDDDNDAAAAGVTSVRSDATAESSDAPTAEARDLSEEKKASQDAPKQKTRACAIL